MPKPPFACASVLLCVFCILLTAPYKVLAVDRFAATETDRISVLGAVQAFYRGEYSQTGPAIKLFEVGGGDPAMNGSFINICIDHNAKVYVWETGLNVRSIQKIRFNPGNTILLDVLEDVMDTNSAIVSHKKTYQVEFYIDNDVLQNRLSVTNRP
jgi:hypothetical protein